MTVELDPPYLDHVAESAESVNAARKFFGKLIKQQYPGSWLTLHTPSLTLTDGETPKTLSLSAVRTPEGEITTLFDLQGSDSHEQIDLTGNGYEYPLIIVEGCLIPGKRIPITSQHMDDLEKFAYHLTSKPH